MSLNGTRSVRLLNRQPNVLGNLVIFLSRMNVYPDFRARRECS
jgi:hypothetical protein